MDIENSNVMDMDYRKHYGRFVTLTDGFNSVNKGQVVKIVGKDKYNFYYNDNNGCFRAVPQNDKELFYVEPRKHINWDLVTQKIKELEY